MVCLSYLEHISKLYRYQVMKSTPNVLSEIEGKYQEMIDLLGKYNACKEPKDKEDIIGEVSVRFNSLEGIEEKIVYPAVQSNLGDNESLCESQERHSKVRLLLGQLSRLVADQDNSSYEKVVKDLQCAVTGLFDQEKSLFKEIEKSDIDLQSLTRQADLEAGVGDVDAKSDFV